MEDKRILVEEDMHTLLKLRATKHKRSIKEELKEILKNVFENDRDLQK